MSVSSLIAFLPSRNTDLSVCGQTCYGTEIAKQVAGNACQHIFDMADNINKEDNNKTTQHALVLAAVQQNVAAYENAAEEWRAQPDVAGAALHQTLSVAHLLPQSLKLRVEVVVSALTLRQQQQHGRKLRFPLYADDATAHWEQYVHDQWKTPCHIQLLSLNRALSRYRINLPAECKASILDFCNLPHEMFMAHEMMRLSPFFAALALRGISWDHVPDLIFRTLYF